MPLVWNKALYDQLYSEAIRHGLALRNFHRFAPAHYQWHVQKLRLQQTMDKMLALPGANQFGNIAIVGGGFGWTSEYLATKGISAVSVETSSYIVDNENVSEEAELRGYMDADPVLIAAGYNSGNNFFDTFAGFVDVATDQTLAPGAIWGRVLHPSGGRTSIPVEAEDLQGNASRNRVRQRFSGNLNAIVTELALDGFGLDDEAGIVGLCDACATLRPNPACQIIHIVEYNEFDQLMINKTLADWRAWLNSHGFSNQIVANTKGEWL